MTQKDEALKMAIEVLTEVEITLIKIENLMLQNGADPKRLEIGKNFKTTDAIKICKAALSEPETVTLPDGWVSVEDRLPSKPCFAYYKNELGNSRTVKAKYVKQFSEEANTDDDWIEYNEADDTYYYPAGWYEMIDNWDDYAFVTINHQVTHWMPLPDAPTLNDKG